jgi:hypothetical protein
MAPLAYIGRYMKGWWDYAIADELHQLAQETAQGNNLGVLYRGSRRLIGLTGTLMAAMPMTSSICSTAWSRGGWWRKDSWLAQAEEETSPRNTA